MITFRIGSLFMLVLVATSCSLGPKPCIPKVEIPEDWHVDSGGELTHADPLKMWELFDDPLLKYYLDNLVYENRDIKVACARVCEAYALRQMSAARLQPIIDGHVNYNRSKPAGGILKSNATGPLAGLPLSIKQQTFLADFDALWELDLFGKNRSDLESASAAAQMDVAAYCDVVITLTAEFGRTYLTLRKIQRNLILANEELRLLQRQEFASAERLAQGLDAEMALLEARAAINLRSAEVATLEGEELANMYRLAVLLGRAPDTLVSELKGNGQVPLMRPQVGIGFPSELLRRRPDIRFAEREIAKTTADAASAIADFFPKLSLTGNYGFQNLHIGNLKGEGESWGYGGDLLTPIFRGGSLKANARRTACIRQQALFAYEQVVLNALEEAESAIARYVKAQNSARAKENAYLHAQQILGHTQHLFEKGLANEIKLSEQQQQAVAAEREWVDQQIVAEVDLIALYKALGGSW